MSNKYESLDAFIRSVQTISGPKARVWVVPPPALVITSICVEPAPTADMGKFSVQSALYPDGIWSAYSNALCPALNS